MHIGLSVYGTAFSMGIVRAPGSTHSTITPYQLMDRALAMELDGVEIPLALLQGEDLQAVRRYAEVHGLFIVLDTSGYDAHKLSEAIEIAGRLGARTVRTMIGGAKIGGDRRPLAGRWQQFLAEVLTQLRMAAASAEHAGINLAVENHQDLASEELLEFCAALDSPHFGITLDTGNPLATAEEPLDFARRIAPYLKHVHLKDYRIYPSKEGYRLARCALGEGVIDFPALFNLFYKELALDITAVIELGALEARHIRVLADDYWPDYPPRTAAQLAHTLRFVLEHAETAGDWRTPFERNEPAEQIIAYEEQQLSASLAYMQALRASFNEV
jgi:sugar phosphate isomerase/epimerase